MTTMLEKTSIKDELKRIAEENDGLLTAEAVVAEAEDKDSPLHECFTWDDSAAAHQYRLYEARQLIRVCVEVLPAAPDTPVEVFVSLPQDRKNEGGGYRFMQTVLSDADMRKQLLESAHEEMELFEKKYQTLSELAEVFSAIRKCKRKQK